MHTFTLALAPIRFGIKKPLRFNTLRYLRSPFINLNQLQKYHNFFRGPLIALINGLSLGQHLGSWAAERQITSAVKISLSKAKNNLNTEKKELAATGEIFLPASCVSA